MVVWHQAEDQGPLSERETPLPTLPSSNKGSFHRESSISYMAWPLLLQLFMFNLCASEISCPMSCKLTHHLPETVPLLNHSVRSWCDGLSDRSFMVDPLSYLSFQTGVTKAVVCGIRHIKEPLLLTGKSSPCGGSGFPLSRSEWSFTI